MYTRMQAAVPEVSAKRTELRKSIQVECSFLKNEWSRSDRQDYYSVPIQQNYV